MLYSIIPPILVVVSVIGIILLIMKKAPEIARLGEEAKQKTRKNISERIMPKIRGRKETEIPILEKQEEEMSISEVKRGGKIFDSLKTKTGKMFSFRGKLGRKSEQLEGEKGEGEDIMEKLNNYPASENEPIEDSQEKETAKFDRPFISERVINPRRMRRQVMEPGKPEMKGKLEAILIDRIAVNPKDTEAYERLGEYYMEIGNYEDAKECFKQVVKLNPNNFNVKMKLKQLERLWRR